MEKFIENLNKASAMLQTADHLLYVTYPLVRDKRILLKILTEIYEAVFSAVNSILQYEYIYKRIELSKNPKENFIIFKEKCAPRFNISEEQTSRIVEIFRITEKHKQSPIEFLKGNKLIIMSDSVQTDAVTIEKMKEYLFLAKEIIKKAEITIKNRG